MKTTIRLFLIASALLLASAAYAADATAAPLSAVALPQSTAEKVVAWLTPLLVPVIVSQFKRLLPKLPSGLLPVLATVLGLVIALINNLVAAHSSNIWLGALLGLLGVAVREVKESLIPADNGGWPPDVPKPTGADPGRFAGRE